MPPITDDFKQQIVDLIPNKSTSSAIQALKVVLQKYQITSITADNRTEFSYLSDLF